ncbi:hypothetical protein NKJ72_11910 [Mesorhizobium sp. M0045]|uniref:hypothetical protein n=1 Tax=Mesorhizobium sp. M0045 TaxID=2956857 RepID=UPI0033358F49
MTIQDDIFDVADVLKGKPESKTFKRITAHLVRIEGEADQSAEVLRRLREGLSALRHLEKMGR